MDAEALRGARLPPSPHFPGAAPGAALLGGDGDRAGCGGAPEQPPRWFRFEPRFPVGASLWAGRFGGSHPEGHGGSRGVAVPLSPVPAVPCRRSFCCPQPLVPSLSPALPSQRHKAQLPAVPFCPETHRVEIQSPACVCGRNLWQLLRNFL